MGITTFFNLMLKNIKLIMFGLIIVLAAFLFNQYNKTKEYKEKYQTATHIADQNFAAIKDSTIQLKVTKKQLQYLDSQLYSTLNKVDSLQGVKSTQITVVKPVYIPVDISVINKLKYDSITKKYGLDFKSMDSIRTIGGTSWFQVNRDGNNLHILPDSTIIKDFRFNFTFVVSQYDDKVNKFTRTKITPFYVDSTGRMGNQISEKQIKFDFRNVEILDKPWQENPVPGSGKGKYKLQSGWGICLSPIGIGYNLNKFIYTPNISFGYYITLRKK
jgi:hypothetical protein